MKMVNSLLLGTAAGVVAVAGAQAADLPVKAKPVQYVKICTLYGDGYYYIPGSDTCIKFGGYIQEDIYYNGNGGGGQPLYCGTGGVQDRTVSNFATRVRARFAVDTRTQTQYGTLRTLAAVTWQNQNATESFNLNRAFIQFAGLTAGRIESFSDTWSLNDSYNMMQQQTGSDTSANGINSIDYTWELGNGATFTIGADERRTGSLANLSNAASTVVGTALTDTHQGEQWPDALASFRIDQAWGYWSIAGVAHNVNATYYSPSGFGVPGYACPTPGIAAAGTALISCGHPNDQVGWAIETGAEFKFPMFGPGDRGGFHFGYSVGATSYGAGQNLVNAGVDLFGTTNGNPGSAFAVGWNSDGIYTNGSSIALTTSWSAQAAYDHHWNAVVNTTAFVGYGVVEYNGQATAALNDAVGCTATGAVTGAAKNSNSFSITGANCSPNYQFLETGLRTNWTLAPGFYFGVQASYIWIWTAYGGDAFTVTKNNWLGDRAAGTYSLQNQGLFEGLARVYRAWNVD